MLRSILVFVLLVVVRFVSRLFFRYEEQWVGDLPPRDWTDLRVIAILNHTSLYEVLLAGYADLPLLWAFARHGVLPIAEKTMRRRIGMFFGMLVRHVVVVTRQRDATWDDVLNRVDRRSVVIILPEGRMMRRDGLDSYGKPMTVRGGVADILETLPEGRMLLLYNGGLHHVQVPGEGLPNLFQTLRVRFELVDIAHYKRTLVEHAGEDEGFRRAVVRDLTHRRDTMCPTLDMHQPTAFAETIDRVPGGARSDQPFPNQI